jgi:hypothetical protein
MAQIGFESEAALVRAFDKFLARTGTGRWRVAHELDTGVGLADVVLYRPIRSQGKSLESLALVNPRLAALCSPDVAGSITSWPALAKLVGGNDESAKRAFRQLELAGLATRRNEAIRVRSMPRAPFEDIVAVEAKLRNWTVALSQAYRNLQFAHESWVLIDATCHLSSRAKETFEARGVGLASLSQQGELWIHATARHGSPFSKTKFWRTQAMLARL